MSSGESVRPTQFAFNLLTLSEPSNPGKKGHGYHGLTWLSHGFLQASPDQIVEQLIGSTKINVGSDSN